MAALLLTSTYRVRLREAASLPKRLRLRRPRSRALPSGLLTARLRPTRRAGLVSLELDSFAKETVGQGL